MSGRGRLVLVWGTRPEALKLGPVAGELKRLGAPLTLLSTGQHTTLLDGLPPLCRTDLSGGASLNLPSHGDWVSWVREAQAPLTAFLDAQRPVSAVVVQGDTMSAYATAIAATSLGLPIAHVEAGLRSHDLNNPCPEEYFRTEITKVADWHYAPTSLSVSNLLNEGVSEGHIHRTGNTGVSALARYSTDGLIHVEKPNETILVTLHRREWLAKGATYVRTCIETLFETARNNPQIVFRWPVHPVLEALVGPLAEQYLIHGSVEGGWPAPIVPPNVYFEKPYDYADTIDELRCSLGCLTDSGGLQEEASALGIPTAVLRTVSDRPESIHAGIAKLFDPSPSGIRAAVHALVSGQIPRIPSSCYGSPDAASQIARHLASLT